MVSRLVNIATQGLYANSNRIGAISNDIANMNTVGYKKAHTRFSEQVGSITGDVNPKGFNAGGQPGPGSRSHVFNGLKAITTRNFMGDGQIQVSDGPFDVAIKGSGQFVVQNFTGERLDQPGQIYLTSAGNFETRPYYTDGIQQSSSEGLYLSDQNGNNVMGIMYNESTGHFDNADGINSLNPIRFSNFATNEAAPSIATTRISLTGNIDSNINVDGIVNSVFSLYNGQGVVSADGTTDSGLVNDDIPMNVQLVKRSTNVWSVIVKNTQTVDGEEVPNLTEEEIPDARVTPLALVESDAEQLANGYKLQFDGGGTPIRMWKGSGVYPAATDEIIDLTTKPLVLSIDVTVPTAVSLIPDPANPTQLPETLVGAKYDVETKNITFDPRALTSYGGDTNVALDQNGRPITLRQFQELTISNDGVIYRSFNDGSMVPLAKLVAASVRSINNLQAVSGSVYAITAKSGDFHLLEFDDANSQVELVTGALESSDVDLAESFSEMIIAQRSYGLSTKTLTTAIEMEQRALELKK